MTPQNLNVLTVSACAKKLFKSKLSCVLLSKSIHYVSNFTVSAAEQTNRALDLNPCFGGVFAIIYKGAVKI